MDNITQKAGSVGAKILLGQNWSKSGQKRVFLDILRKVKTLNRFLGLFRFYIQKVPLH